MKQEKIIVMGGSFNPPTRAHLKIMQSALDGLQAEKGYFVPVSFAYLKRKMMKCNTSHLCLSDALRLRMLQSMCGEDSRLQIYTGEMQEIFAVTSRTMGEIQEAHPQAELYFVIGADKLALMEEFGRKGDFLERYGVIVFTREDADPEKELESSEVLSGYRDAFVLMKQPEGIGQISSTAVRKLLWDCRVEGKGRTGAKDRTEALYRMLPPSVHHFLPEIEKQEFLEEILSFQGEYAFLDNSYPAPVTYEGITYPCVDCAFQASRCTDEAEKKKFAAWDSGKAKAKGSRIMPAVGWEEQKPEIMEQIIRAKFRQNPELMKKLTDTGEKILIAGNRKKEKYWGVNLITWQGENRLGKILMKIRQEAEEKGEKTDDV